MGARVEAREKYLFSLYGVGIVEINFSSIVGISIIQVARSSEQTTGCLNGTSIQANRRHFFNFTSW